MIPLKDDIQSSRFPIVNTGLIVANCVIFIYELSLGNGSSSLITQLGMIPKRILDQGLVNWGTILSSMFLHGGWAHIIGNMLYLYIFGDNVEDAMGHLGYLVFYLLCGFAAAWGHILSGPGSTMPTVGASGAIAGVLGAYLVMYPKAGVMTLIPLGFFFRVVRIPAIVVLGFWIVLQLLFGVISIPLARAAGGGVAWFAHVGGFLAGVALVWIFAKDIGSRRRLTSNEK